MRLDDGGLMFAKREELERTPILLYGAWRRRLTLRIGAVLGGTWRSKVARAIAATLLTLAAAATVAGFVLDHKGDLLPTPSPPPVAGSSFNVYDADGTKQWTNDLIVRNDDRLWFALCLCTTNRGLSNQTVEFSRLGPAAATETLRASFGGSSPLQLVLRSSNNSPIRLNIYSSTPQLTDTSGSLLEHRQTCDVEFR